MFDLFYLAKDWDLEEVGGQELASDLDRDGRVGPKDAHYLLGAWHQAFP